MVRPSCAVALGVWVVACSGWDVSRRAGTPLGPQRRQWRAPTTRLSSSRPAAGEEAEEAPSSATPAALASPGVRGKTTLTRFMLEHTRVREEHQDMEALLASVQMACKTIAVLVQRAAVDGLTGLGGEINVQGEEQKKLDVISNDVLKAALQYTGKMGMVASEEEELPMLVEEAYDSQYVAVFDPLDGSSNIDASIATGTIFGIFQQTGACSIIEGRDKGGSSSSSPGGGGGTLDDEETRCLLNALQPGGNLVAAGYCMYSSSTILVITLGEGVHGFTLDPALGEFVLSHPSMKIPDRGTIYSLNEANSRKWDPWLVDHVESLKDRGYSARYIGSMVGDVHRTLLYGGFYGYPADIKNPNGKIRLLYEAAPISFLVEQAGGRCTTGTSPIIGIVPDTVHQRVPVFLGSKDDIADLEAACAKATSGKEEKKPVSSRPPPSK